MVQSRWRCSLCVSSPYIETLHDTQAPRRWWYYRGNVATDGASGVGGVMVGHEVVVVDNGGGASGDMVPEGGDVAMLVAVAVAIVGGDRRWQSLGHNSKIHKKILT